MIRNLIRHFQIGLQLNSINTLQQFRAQTATQTLYTCNSLLRGFHQKHYLEKQTTDDDVNYLNNDDDPLTAVNNLDEIGYITTQRVDRDAYTKKYALIDALRTRFRLNAKEEQIILDDEIVLKSYRETNLVRTLEMLCNEGITKKTFVELPWLITLDKTTLTNKLTVIRTMQVRDINHFTPYLRLTLTRLRKLVYALKSEAENIPFGNRVYYLSDRLKVDPYIVSKYLYKRLFVLEMPFDMLERNLRHMFDYNVPSMNILKDLWAFKYTPKSIKTRFERAKTAKKDKIMPWMVRCPETILQKSLKLSLDELAILGDKTSNIEYIAERLKFDIEQTRAIMSKHPQVYRCRVPKIKEVLDYLLDEAGFTRYEIAQVPRILCHSLQTTKTRLEELKAIGCRPSSLVIVCRSKREYEKFVRMWQGFKERGYISTYGGAELQKQSVK